LQRREAETEAQSVERQRRVSVQDPLFCGACRSVSLHPGVFGLNDAIDEPHRAPDLRKRRAHRAPTVVRHSRRESREASSKDGEIKDTEAQR